ncbi:hypothetical protein [Mucilaginibacter jinjuensis]|uniref:Uncharacterized protein n=1 Tax=Mucilaginibacter jinjuensis TaxID=1176721 RepID=A0ABY7T2Z6_9SPHI|nr:hypothetical protein [Mucilaginibacter jinjuensis]WCT10639.1 hypothetical protein PQO05_18030 [Mucilaginibacter jinjuensis]
MFKNLFSFSRSQSVIIATLIVILVLGVLYFFVYVPHNQINLETKQFRALQNTEQKISDKVDNSLALVHNLIRNYKANAADYDTAKIHRYIDSYPQKDFNLSINTRYKNPKGNTAEDTTVNFDDEALSIGIDTGKVQIKITYTFKQFIEPLLPGDVFDEYIILSQSNVIYQSFPSGITQMIADSLKSKKSAFANAQVKDVSLSGGSYKLFSQQLNLKTASPIIIAGLLTKKHYNSERNELPEQVVLFLLLIAVTAILALPWIKLYQMGGQDRMTAMDGLLSLAIPMLLMSVLFFTFLSYNGSFRNGVSDFEGISKRMSATIKDSLSDEVAQTYNVLVTADSIYDHNKSQVKYPKKDLWDDSLIYNKLQGILSNTKVNQLYQLNTDGHEMQESWMPDHKRPPPGDFSNRAYFYRLKNQQPLYLKHDSQKPFYIEQVTSWTTGIFTSVMAIPHKGGGAPYTAMSFDLKTFDHPVLTPGFLYCIINMQGDVLYHANKSKQLNENLTTQFSAQDELKAALGAHSDKLFNTKYSGKQYNVYLSPLADLPYAIVIMEDKSYDNIRALNSFVFSFSMLFTFFIVLALELFIVFVLSVKKHYYRKHYFDISWIGPDSRFRQEYKLALWGNIATILLLLCWIGNTHFLECFYMLLTASGLSYLFLNALYAIFYKAYDIDKYRLKVNAVIALAGIIVLLDAVAAYQTEIGRLLIFQVLLILILGSILFFHDKLKERLNTPITANYIRGFSLMTFTRFIITSGLPVLLFYISITNYEIKLVTRYRHVQFAKTIQENYLANTKALDSASRYIDHTWINSVKIIDKKDTLYHSKGDSCTRTLFKLLTIGDKNQITGMNEFDRDPTDSSWQYSSLLEKGVGVTYYHLNDKSYLEVKSGDLNYKLPVKGYLGFIYWVLFFGALAFFWLSLHYILRRLFALNLPAETCWQDIDTLLLKDNELNSRIFLIGSPGSGKMKKIMDLINGKAPDKMMGDNTLKKINYYVADMILMPNDKDIAENDTDWTDLKKDALDPKYDLVIVDHFGYDIKNPVSNRLKLNFLEELLQDNPRKVIIISTVHPINFLDSLNSQQAAYAAMATSGASDANTPAPNRAPEHDLERWHVLLGHFKIAIQKLNSEDVTPDVNDPTWQKILMYETRSGHFFDNMGKPIADMLAKRVTDKNKVGIESLSIKLGITAHYFYMYMWQSLTKEEKFLLYDLAEDGLVNPYDDYNLILLICKGLIIRENGILKIFNHGFRNFILTAIGGTEAMQIQRQIRDNGNWSKLKVPLVILIVAVLIFLLASQQETYTTLVKYLTAIAVGVPTVLKIFSFFNSSESKVT